MSQTQRIHVVCEGKSDRAYLVELQRFLEQDIPSDPTGNNLQPIVFVPRPDSEGVGGGYYDRLVPVYEAECKDLDADYATPETFRFRPDLLIWADSDVYIQNTPRGQSFTGTDYQNRPPHIPIFHFSYHKFEDFVAWHQDDATFAKWKQTFIGNGHASAPLYNGPYMVDYQTALPNYTKRYLPRGLITVENIANLKRHIADPIVQAMKSVWQPGISFAEFLVDMLATSFPWIQEWQ